MGADQAGRLTVASFDDVGDGELHGRLFILQTNKLDCATSVIVARSILAR